MRLMYWILLAEAVGLDEYLNGTAHPVLAAQFFAALLAWLATDSLNSKRARTGWPKEREETICFLGGTTSSSAEHDNSRNSFPVRSITDPES